MEVNRLGMVVVVDNQGCLVGTVTDGDIRRAILANISLDSDVSVVLERKKGTPHQEPVTAQEGTERSVLLTMLKEHSINHLPMLDNRRRVVGLVTLDDFLTSSELPLQAVVMAGGQGLRLRPLTEELPKPMLEVGGRPLMEIIVEQLKTSGVRRIHVTGHHKAEKIIQHFGDGKNFDVQMSYVEEEKPLGTVGALSLMDQPKDTMLVMNGDILTQIDFRSFHLFHKEHQADLTVAVRPYEHQVPYGVVQCEGTRVVGLAEKPRMNFMVNAGIYLLEPEVHRLIPKHQHCDMTDLIQILLDAGRSVVSFPIHEEWLDIGHHHDYEKAQTQVASKTETS